MFSGRIVTSLAEVFWFQAADLKEQFSVFIGVIVRCDDIQLAPSAVHCLAFVEQFGEFEIYGVANRLGIATSVTV
jgi:hypothetical protein